MDCTGEACAGCRAFLDRRIIKNPAARATRPATPTPTPMPMPTVLPVPSAPSHEELEDVPDAVGEPDVPVSSAKIQPLMWAANKVADALVVTVVGFHSLLLLLV